MPDSAAHRVCRRFVDSSRRRGVLDHIDPRQGERGRLADETPRMHLAPIQIVRGLSACVYAPESLQVGIERRLTEVTPSRYDECTCTFGVQWVPSRGCRQGPHGAEKRATWGGALDDGLSRAGVEGAGAATFEDGDPLERISAS